MKTSVKNIIMIDYFSKVLFLISVVATILLIAIIAVSEFSALGIIIPVLIVLIALLSYKVFLMKKLLERVVDNKVEGKVIGTMKNNGNFYVSLSYEFKGETYKTRVGLLIGPLLKIKLGKMESMNLVVDELNPKKAYIADLLYK